MQLIPDALGCVVVFSVVMYLRVNFRRQFNRDVGTAATGIYRIGCRYRLSSQMRHANRELHIFDLYLIFSELKVSFQNRNALLIAGRWQGSILFLLRTSKLP